MSISPYLCMIMAMMISCSAPNKEQVDTISYPQSGHGLTTEALAQAYCGACHQFPDPGLLSKSVWEKEVLKDMGRRLGIRSEDYDPFFQRSMMDAYILRSAGVYPLDTLISQEDWQRIVDYYLQEAPDDLPEPVKSPVLTKLPNFNIRIFNELPAKPLTTLVKIDTIRNSIYWGSRLGDLIELSGTGKIKRQLQLNYGVSDIVLNGSNEYLLTMGTMDPSEEAVGTLEMYQGGYQGQQLLTKLQRPVHLSLTDLDHNGERDLLVSQFGDQTGRLSWFQKSDTGFNEYPIKTVPGVIKTVTGDFNGDGREDIMALMTQGNEGISVFYNQGKGRFKERRLLQFPPVYGSSSFELLDFNGDGALDILHTAGDNADFSYSLKPYHGVRIFINQGDFVFEENYFYPLHGAMNAKAGDFDQDGDIDIAAIAFFPDFNAENPEGFVYLENQGKLDFKAYTFPEAANGRWLVMDTADFDSDGDLDVVLGSLLFKISAAPEELIERWTQSNYHMILLENTTN